MIISKYNLHTNFTGIAVNKKSIHQVETNSDTKIKIFFLIS